MSWFWCTTPLGTRVSVKISFAPWSMLRIIRNNFSIRSIHGASRHVSGAILKTTSFAVKFFENDPETAEFCSTVSVRGDNSQFAIILKR